MVPKFGGLLLHTGTKSGSVECVAENARRASREEIRAFLLLNSSLGEVHEVMALLTKGSRCWQLPPGTGFCKPVFGGTDVRCSFSGISSIPVRLCGDRWEVGGQPCASWQPPRHSTDGWTRLACDSLCEQYSLVRCTSSFVRASELKPHTGMYFGLYRQRRHSGCMFPTNLKHRQSSKTQNVH